MTVSTVSTVATGLPRAVSTQNVRATLSLSALSSAAQTTVPVDIETVTYPSELQKQGASLRIAAQGIARSGSQLDASSAGVSEISSLISQLQSIATRASSGGLSDSQRTILNAEFLSLRARITNVSIDTEFEGSKLLDGKAAPIQAGNQTVNIGGFTPKDLFGDQDLDITSVEGAQQAAATLATAQLYVSNQQTIISTAQADVEVAASTVESAVQNQEASRSSLNDAEITTGSTITAQSRIQSQAADALIAQTNRLPADILRLIAE